MKKTILLVGSLCCSLVLFAAAGAAAGPVGRVAADSTLDEYRAAVEAHPDSGALHAQFITAFRKSVPGASWKNIDSVLALLKPQYDEWIKRFPSVAAVPYALGHAFANAESPEAKPYLLKAVAIDPKLAEAWADLAIDAERWGDFDASDGYLKKATEADPSSPDYASSYAFAMQRTDFAKYRRLSLDVANNFPDSERGAQMLYWLAYRSSDEKDKLDIYRMLKAKFPPAKFSWSASGMLNYFDLLMEKDPAAALALASEMKPLADDDYAKKRWDYDLSVAEKVIEADKALDRGDAAEAVKVLATIPPNRYSDTRETIALLKARAADAAGNTAAAVDSLLVFYAKEPSDMTHRQLLHYAGKMDKDAAWVDEAVQRRRLASAREAPVFDLYAYQTGRSVSLKDYRGKVVLLTFWFPGCGPCRGEFPHFQEVLNKFKGRDIAYVGINVVPSQDPYVLPFMRTSGYGFTALRDKDHVAEKAYHVQGEPSNYLIDRDGRIIFSDFMIQSPKAQRMLELMIASLLAQQG